MNNIKNKELISEYAHWVQILRLTAVYIIGILASGGFAPISITLTAGLIVGITLLYFFLLLFWLPASFKNRSCIITEGAIIKEQGIFTRRRTKLPFYAINRCILFRTPLEKVFDLCSVLLISQDGWEWITGLPYGAAGAIRANV